MNRPLKDAEADVLRALIAGVALKQRQRNGEFTTPHGFLYSASVVNSLAVRKLVTVKAIRLDVLHKAVQITEAGVEAFKQFEAQYGRK